MLQCVGQESIVCMNHDINYYMFANFIVHYEQRKKKRENLNKRREKEYPILVNCCFVHEARPAGNTRIAISAIPNILQTCQIKRNSNQ